MQSLERGGNLEVTSPRSCSQTKRLSKFESRMYFWSERDAQKRLPQAPGESLEGVCSRTGEQVLLFTPGPHFPTRKTG